VKGKLANGVGSQYSHTTSELCVSNITNADAHTSAASSRLNWRPRRLNGLVRFGERRNLVSARVPSHFKRTIITYHYLWGRSCFNLQSLSVQVMFQEQLRKLATLPELLNLANGGCTLLRNVCTIRVYKSPRYNIPKEMNCHWRSSHLYATQGKVFFSPHYFRTEKNLD